MMTWLYIALIAGVLAFGLLVQDLIDHAIADKQNIKDFVACINEKQPADKCYEISERN